VVEDVVRGEIQVAGETKDQFVADCVRSRRARPSSPATGWPAVTGSSYSPARVGRRQGEPRSGAY
jgi:hypothetical protein